GRVPCSQREFAGPSGFFRAAEDSPARTRLTHGHAARCQGSPNGARMRSPRRLYQRRAEALQGAPENPPRPSSPFPFPISSFSARAIPGRGALLPSRLRFGPRDSTNREQERAGARERRAATCLSTARGYISICMSRKAKNKPVELALVGEVDDWEKD